MSLKNLTVEEVRKEISNIVERFPYRTGGEVDEYNGKSCVYFKDENGDDVVHGTWEYPDSYDTSRLVTPVCIIGQWVNDFHPELKDDEDFQAILFKNAILSTSPEAARILDADVHEYLSEVQTQQDDVDSVWFQLEI